MFKEWLNEHKETLMVIPLLIFVLIFLVYYVTNLEAPDYIKMVNDITPQEMDQITELRREAFNYALSCSGTDVGITFEDIRWFIYPDREIHFEEGSNYLDLAGWYDRENNAIWIAYPYRKTRWVNAHESLHALGVVGHGSVFTNCRLLAEQQP